MSLLKVKNLSISFRTPHGDLKAVDDVSFEVRKGESLAIVGESGCGKSSLALAIMGLINRRHPSLDGEIIFDSRDLSRMNEKQMQDIRGNRIAMIFQDPMTSLNPYLPIGIQIAESQCFHRGTNKKTALNNAADLVERVGIPDGRNKINRYPHEFSGGMRQRALIASALSCSPELLIADEPTTALDVTIQAQILSMIQREIKARELSLLIITHDLGVVANICDRVLVMYAGGIVEEGNVKTIYSSPSHPYTHALLNSVPRMDSDSSIPLPYLEGQPPNLIDFEPKGCVFAPRCAFVQGKCWSEIPKPRKIDRGGQYCCHFELDLKTSLSKNIKGNLPNVPDASKVVVSENSNSGKVTIENEPPCMDNAILSVENLTVKYTVAKRFDFLNRTHQVLAVDDVSLRLKEGRVLGIAGESGSGKSTLVRAIAGLIKPSSGKIFYWNRELNSMSRPEFHSIRQEIQLIFQDPYASLNPRMKAWQIIAEPLLNFGQAKSCNAKSLAIELMEVVGLSPTMAHRYPHEFSGGQRQRICIARSLAPRPKLILCDEPVSALDVSVQAQIINLLKDLQKKFNLSMIFISHDLNVVRQISDSVAIMYKGKIVEHAQSDEIYLRAKHPYTRELINSIPIPDPTVRTDMIDKNGLKESMDEFSVP